MSQKRIKTQRTGNLLPRAAYTGSPQPRVPTAFRLSKISSLSHRDRHVWRKHARLHDPHTRCLMRCGCNLDLKRSSPSARQSWPQVAKGEAARTAVRRLCELVCFVHTVPCDIFVSSLIKKKHNCTLGSCTYCLARRVGALPQINFALLSKRWRARSLAATASHPQMDTGEGPRTGIP